MQARQDDVARVVAAATEGLRHHPDPGPALDRLTERLTELTDRWDLVLGEVYGAGVGGPVVAVTAAGVPAVLKVDRATRSFAAQVATMEAARGQGYAAVLASDVSLGAVLLERLGPSLARAGLSPETQVDHLVAPLARAWLVPSAAVPAEPGFDKAAELAGILGRLPGQVLGEEGRRRWAPAVARAVELADHLSATRDRTAEVLCHGDPHQGNALLAEPGTSADPRTAAYKLVDPDGIVAEAAYDVGVVLRDFSRELLAEPDPRAARAWFAQLCRRAAEATGTDAERVGQWAFVERVTTGLYLQWFRDTTAARTFLDAALLLDARPAT